MRRRTDRGGLSAQDGFEILEFAACVGMIMRHLGLGLLLLVMAVTAQAVAPEYSEFFRDQDLPSIQIAQFTLDGLPKARPYQLTLSIVPVRPLGTATFGAGFNSASRLHPVVDQPVAWASNNYWGRFFDNDSSA